MVFWTTLILILAIPIVLYFIQKNNMEYYSKYGRSDKEIEEWLKSRKWYDSFVKNIRQEVIDEYKDDDENITIDEPELNTEINNRINENTSGENDTLTISNAFYWKSTPEGTEYWGSREREFLAWYFGQYIYINIFKIK